MGTAICMPTIFILSALVLMVSGLSNDIHQADVAIVLGNQIEPSGQAFKHLKAKLNKTIQLFQKGLFQYVVVSGSVGVEDFDEAVVMKQYLSKGCRFKTEVQHLDQDCQSAM